MGEFPFSNGPSFEDLIAEKALRLAQDRGTVEDRDEMVLRRG